MSEALGFTIIMVASLTGMFLVLLSFTLLVRTRPLAGEALRYVLHPFHSVSSNEGSAGRSVVEGVLARDTLGRKVA